MIQCGNENDNADNDDVTKITIIGRNIYSRIKTIDRFTR